MCVLSYFENSLWVCVCARAWVCVFVFADSSNCHEFLGQPDSLSLIILVQFLLLSSVFYCSLSPPLSSIFNSSVSLYLPLKELCLFLFSISLHFTQYCFLERFAFLLLPQLFSFYILSTFLIILSRTIMLLLLFTQLISSFKCSLTYCCACVLA